MKEMKDAGLRYIDDEQFDRAQNWLIQRRNSEKPGTFLMNPRYLDTFG